MWSVDCDYRGSHARGLVVEIAHVLAANICLLCQLPAHYMLYCNLGKKE